MWDKGISFQVQELQKNRGVGLSRNGNCIESIFVESLGLVFQVFEISLPQSEQPVSD
jgi:hypothetical protein